MNETAKKVLQQRLRSLRDDYARARDQLKDRIEWVEQTRAYAEELAEQINDISEELMAAGAEDDLARVRAS